MQKDCNEKLMSTATEIGQNLIIQMLRLCIAVVKESMPVRCKKKKKKIQGKRLMDR